MTSGNQDSSQYSSRSQQCCSMNGLDSSTDFQRSQSPFKTFRNRSKCTTYGWYHCNPVCSTVCFFWGGSLARSEYLALHVPQFSFNSLARSRYLSFFSHSFCGQQSRLFCKFFFFSFFFFFFWLIIIKSGLQADIRLLLWWWLSSLLLKRIIN